MSKRALFLLLAAAAACLPLLACGGQKDEDAFMEDEARAGGFDGCGRRPGRPARRCGARDGRRDADRQGQLRRHGARDGPRSRWTPTPSASPSTRSPSTTRKCRQPEQDPPVGPGVRQGRRRGKLPGADRGGRRSTSTAASYRPHVFGVMAGQPIKILNSDGTLHNIHALPKKNAEFNIGQPFKGMETVKKFDTVEVPHPIQVRRPQVDGRLHGRLQPPVLRGDQRPGRFRDQEPARRATTSSRPGTRSTARRRRT